MQQADHQMCVLMFHGIGPVTHELEPGEGDYWIDWPLFDAIVDYSKNGAARACDFTFDDGNASDVEAARRLHAAGLTGRFFILAGRIDAPGYLSREEVREIAALGMEIGIHGRDHIDWRQTDAASLRREIDDSRTEIGELVGGAIDTLAIPYGLYNKRVWTYLAASSFKRIYTSDRGLARPGDRFVRRNPVMRMHRIADIDAIVRDAVSIPARVRRTVMPALKRAV